jgi:hypothetical protein
MGSVGQQGEGLRIGHQPDLADGAEAFDGLELIQHVHRLHGHGEPDAVGEAAREPVHVRGLPASDTAVVGIEEADEAYTGPSGFRGRIRRAPGSDGHGHA